jgi:hypothetical protein
MSVLENIDMFFILLFFCFFFVIAVGTKQVIPAGLKLRF